MDKETAGHIGQVGNYILNHWQLAIFFIGAVSGSIYFYLRKVFATHELMNECRTDIQSSLIDQSRKTEIMLHEFKRDNAEQHQLIHEDIRQIRDHIVKFHGQS